ncbi:unnamed protein product [Arabidopsis lyrata]|uniref:Adenosylmethionine decarboxylase n=1 Tax=Arabidopsis lyrata subsp. lyrata TaxID=81972 RepID=D7L5M3_ARALL|nr:S-adenosylmethionine decarboxylase proenzyme [Arabidopsis lyrata subsp. lyrata]EFH59249.1 hypothetical protein ARALYDRAFT_897930 [Arabidopsis lyrata subsp. lyrata]CAH8260685.1 unnamed protein product [Arabidopsis lyrata]|eukprot:XP_002882990.1 S-adenosylmethionine decarboxylase proenzyme [Arabidopsis lyrata subsp. lyrata]
MTTEFEGVEKRLEIVFRKEEDSLREVLTEEVWHDILRSIDCWIVDKLLTASVDSYLLSASSLFVFDDRLIIKTCGEIKLFQAITKILGLSKRTPVGVKFTRGTYFWPERQPEPHGNFPSEVSELRRNFLELDDTVTAEFGTDEKHKFHIFAAAASGSSVSDGVTVEILMTGIEKSKASVFFKDSGIPGSMTSASGIDQIFPESSICDHEFPTCGYSMNGVVGSNSVYTIHVTPEEGFSFASFEVCGCETHSLEKLVQNVLSCFNPSTFTAVLHTRSKLELLDLNIEGRICKEKDCKNLGSYGTMTYLSF